jgi:hypothetical protein
VNGVKKITSGSTARIDLPEPAGDHEGQRHHRHRCGALLPHR